MRLTSKSICAVAAVVVAGCSTSSSSPQAVPGDVFVVEESVAFCAAFDALVEAGLPTPRELAADIVATAPPQVEREAQMVSVTALALLAAYADAGAAPGETVPTDQLALLSPMQQSYLDAINGDRPLPDGPVRDFFEFAADSCGGR